MNNHNPENKNCPAIDEHTNPPCICPSEEKPSEPPDADWREELEQYCDHTNCTEKCELIIFVENLIASNTQSLKAEWEKEDIEWEEEKKVAIYNNARRDVIRELMLKMKEHGKQFYWTDLVRLIVVSDMKHLNPKPQSTHTESLSCDPCGCERKYVQGKLAGERVCKRHRET